MGQEQKTISFPYQARYHQIGEISADTEELWMVCHGYGQLAPYFINHFRVLASANRVIVAPEGLNRFYLQGFQGRVGATWMTKEDRLTDISNYLSFLDTLIQSLLGHRGNDIKLNVLGFSQGAATVSRWVSHTSFLVRKLVLWAGIFPPDLNIPKSKRKLISTDVLFIYGTEDPFLKKGDRIQEQKAIAQHLGIKPTIISFDGEHVIDRETLLSIV